MFIDDQNRWGSKVVEFSVCAPTYNNAGMLRICLNSIINALAGLDFEIVVVDEYSTDGSYEILRDYAQRYDNIKVLRFEVLKSVRSRGLGRQLAFESSSGRYIITIDTDTEYYSEKLRKILVAYKQGKLGKLTAVKFWGSLGIYPRPLVEKAGGWRDYSVGEDHDFLARLSKVGSFVFLPINVEVNEPCEEWRKGLFKALRFNIIVGEKRYFQGFQLIKRTFRNMVDEYCALGVTTRNLVIRHRYLGIGMHKTLLAVVLLLFSKIINLSWKRPITYADRDLHNAHYNYYNFIKNIVDPRKFGFNVESGPSFLDEHLKFIVELKPDMKDGLKFYYLQTGTENKEQDLP